MFYGMHEETYNERQKFWEYIGMRGEMQKKASTSFIKAALKKVSSARSVFAVQLLQDWLSLGDYYSGWDTQDLRINFPGVKNDTNWNITIPLPLEKLLNAEINKEIKEINSEAGRI